VSLYVFCFPSQLSSGNPVYDKYYRQVDPSGTGHVAATDAALFLKKSGLTDLILGQIWDLADVEQKGCLNKQQFFIALRLVACAQNGLEVMLSSLNVAVPPPKFHDTSSPLLPSGGVSVDCPWVVKAEEKVKFDTIFDSLAPVNGMLSGDKVKPVLLNSKLPVDILGRVWDLSDIDRDGMLDRDEFAVAMYLVYRALEKETVPMSLPPQLVPPSKRKKPWVVTPTEKAKYDEMFTKTDADMDGLVSGPEVRDIFLKTGLPSTTLARIWQLCDMNNMGKLTRDQFALALHLINQKLTKGIEPPQSLLPEMIPPSDRMTSIFCKNVTGIDQAADFSAIKELDSLSNEIVDLQREKTAVEQEIKEREESIRQRSSEVQDLQDEVQRETSELQRLQAQRQEVQDVLEKLDAQKVALEEQLGQIRQLCSEENELVGPSSRPVGGVGWWSDTVSTCTNLEPPQPPTQEITQENTPPASTGLDFFQPVFSTFCCLPIDPFGGDPFKGTDPFAADAFFKQPSADPFTSSDPFGGVHGSSEPSLFDSQPNGKAVPDPFDPFAAVFGNDTFTGGFADFSALSKANGDDPFGSSSTSGNKNLFKDESQPSSPEVPPALPPKTGTPTRPPPPPPGHLHFILISGRVAVLHMLGVYRGDLTGLWLCVCVRLPAHACLCVAQYPTEEDMIEWAKRESEREEKERLARLTRQEQEDLELAIALSKSEFS
uniref:Epidermal growth factor receptor pathway substrate 15 n=1 Tax=Paramormyrops kingsleyae TaxID=1676925 RepID=A0A3B3S1A6_9TELE